MNKPLTIKIMIIGIAIGVSYITSSILYPEAIKLPRFLNTSKEQTIEIAQNQIAESSENLQQTDEVELASNTNINMPASCDINCKDCWLFPVGKNKPLRSDYVPSVITPELTGRKEITKETNTALVKLFEESKLYKLNLTMVSGYRSYNVQNTIFYGYVANEKRSNPSLTNEQAIAKANIYSALPGESEHQLGTTVDINCVGCSPFGNDSNNLKVYEFLQKNAHKYGFIISYYKGSEAKTGYKYEPWHLRYIGTDLAQEYITLRESKQEVYTLQDFLKEQCLD